ncbi:MAG: Fe-S cluster assembly protein SufD, partial [Alphaproteobacteria bacterium]
AHYQASGLPTRRVEAWRYTNLNHLVEAGFRPAVGRHRPAVGAIPPAALPIDAHRIAFVQGRFEPQLSSRTKLPAGVEVFGLADALARDARALEPYLGRIAELDGMPLAALNTAFLSDGLVLRVADGVRLERPLHVVSLGVGADESTVFQPRHLILLGAGAEATLIESHVGLDAGPYFSNAVTEIDLGPWASLSHYRLQREGAAATHIAATVVRLAEASRYDGLALQAGGALGRDEVRVAIVGQGADCRLGGIYMASGRQLVDNVTLVDHAAPGSRSRQTFKGVLDGEARGVFQGKILVRPQAQKTDGHQLSRGLLLSPRAEIDTKPELEIYADDVKCSHGAATGALDEDAIFYLRSRGIEPDEARRMLIEAFVGEVVDGIPSTAIREAFGTVVGELLDRAGEAGLVTSRET